jgi:hypothetical protein
VEARKDLREEYEAEDDADGAFNAMFVGGEEVHDHL